MALTVVGGQIVTGSPDTYQPWDSTLSQNPYAATQDNKGCAPGWATIYVQDSLTGGLVKVCRKLDQTVLGPGAPAVIAQESGPDWYDQSVMSVASAAEQVVTGVGEAAGALTPFNWSVAALIGAAALLLFAWRK